MEYIKQLADITKTDQNNCALNAMSIVLNKPYYEVYQTFKLHGRVGGKGASVRMITTALNVLKQGTPEKAINNWQMPTKLKLSLAKFAKMYPKGKYYVIKSRHALALIDGVWYDNQIPNPRAYVKYFFKVD
jgi:hypothetical protein